MGYRDDETALASRCELEEAELAKRRAELAGLEATAATLERRIRRKRWRLRARRGLSWAGRHWLFTGIVLVTAVSSAYCGIRDATRGYLAAREKERALLARGCRAWLEVGREAKGAAVTIDGQLLGTAPLRQRVCPGPHLVRVLGSRSIPWQRPLLAPATGEVALHPALIPLRSWERPPGGTLFLSEPSGASVFLDGLEVGVTPLFVASSPLQPRATVAAEGRAPVAVTLRGTDTVWFQLAPLAAAPASLPTPASLPATPEGTDAR